MTRVVLVFGFISGAILSAIMLISALFPDQIGFGWIIGYTSMVLAFLMVYFGIRSYRDNVSGGAITFGKAFTVGICIAIIASLCYVATWEFVYHRFFPDFMEKYSSHVIDKARASGATQAELDAKTIEMGKMREQYKNPFYRMAYTFIEAFPVGLLFTLVSAALLRRKRTLEGTSPSMTNASALS